MAEEALAVGHVLLRETPAGRWWRLHPDRTRTLVKSYDDAVRLVTTWTAWEDPPPVPIAAGASWLPSSEYVGARYSIVTVEAAELAAWPDVTDGGVLR
jgi:hypothetical protein